jgi:hypothetical protein
LRSPAFRSNDTKAVWDELASFSIHLSRKSRYEGYCSRSVLLRG